MDPQPWQFGDFSDWAGRTNLHPVAIAAIIVLGIAMLILPRRFAILPMALLACFIAPAQRVIVLTLNFDLLRIMVVIGWLRLLFRGELRPLRVCAIDVLLVLWAISATTVYSIRELDQRSLIYMLGMSFDCIGMYLLFRFLLRTWDDTRTTILCFAAISLPVAIAFIYEHATGYNVFSVFGYVPEITYIREGRLRCQGAFAHPILAGCFWASLIPMMAVCVLRPGWSRWLGLLGLMGSSLVVTMCASSTPVMAVLFGILAGLMFFCRRWLRLIRWLVVALLIFLHLAMKDPVWHLLARVDLVSGSTGWHRYFLVDQAIKHFDQWWLMGTTSTQNWDVLDITNQYILYGLNGGLISMLLFIAVIVAAYRTVGRGVCAKGRDAMGVAFTWALGVALFQHTMNYIAVSYFQQIIVVWYLLLAMIATANPAPRGMVSECDCLTASPVMGRVNSRVRRKRRPAPAPIYSTPPLESPSPG